MLVDNVKQYVVLPNGYKKLNYIRNASDAYIDTGFILNQDSKVELEVSESSVAHLFGSRQSATNANFTIADGHFDFCNYENFRVNYSDSVALSRKYKLSMSKERATVEQDGQERKNFVVTTYSNFTCPNSAYIFRVSGNPYSESRSIGNLYYCKIWDNGILARNYVPCINPENKVGLYDSVNNTFSKSSGNSEFVAGDVLQRRMISAYFGDKRINRIYKHNSETVKYIEIPDEYQQVEYIQSSGNAHITTDVYPDENIRIKIDFESDASFGRWIFGSRSGQGVTNSFGVYHETSTQYWAQIGGNNRSTTGGNIVVPSTLGRHVLDIDGTSAKCDNVKYLDYANRLSSENAKRIVLFGLMSGNSVDSRKFSGKIYDVKFYRSNVLEEHFVPCIRKSDNIVGMYEKINGNFYSGIGGNFTSGPEILVNKKDFTVYDVLPDGYTRLNYIESNGTQYINTGIVPDPDTIKVVTRMSTNGDLFSDSGSYALFGMWNSFNFRIFKSSNAPSSGQLRVQSAGNGMNISGIPLDDTILNINFSKDLLFINNVNYSIIPGQGTSAGGRSIYIFTSLSSETEWLGYRNHIRCYEFKIYNNGSLVRSLIPCYRNSDNIPGMYDIVNNKFYSSEGTSEFLPGDEI